jgi:RND family efflux transporter MFP subunit
MHFKQVFRKCFFSSLILLYGLVTISPAADGERKQGPPAVPVKTAKVIEKMVSDQISLIGTAEAVAESKVAAEVAGLVEYFPVREGDFVKKGALLVRLKSTYLELRLKGALASRDSIKANLENAEKELVRLSELRRSKSIAETTYDNALYTHRSLSKKLLQSEVEIEQLEYEIGQHKVLAPFAGFVSKEHTQVGEWINAGGPVTSLMDLSKIQITVDVPERYAVTLSAKSRVGVEIKSLSNNSISARVSTILPHGDSTSRTFPVRIRLANPGYKIKSGMEAIVTFNLRNQKKALLVPKDAVVTSGNSRLVFVVMGGKALPVPIKILGYYGGDVALDGNIKKNAVVVTRGNERLRPGQAVQILP